ncbi:MAG TPA: prolyl oligopeptidase family serine peptidase, partial [Candidatus Xenobia bacterium]
MQFKRMLVMSLLGLAPLWASPLGYPPAPRSNTVDHYGQVAVPDPYRPLENLDSPATRRWVQAETRLTESVLSRIPVRAKLRKRLAELWNYTREWPPDKEAGRYFMFRQAGLQPQRVLYVKDGPQGEPRRLLDPNPLSADHTTSIADISVSKDGKRLAWGVSEKGSDWQTWRVRDVDTGQDTSDELHWLKFTRAAWTPDNAGFYYGRYEKPGGDTTMTAVNQAQRVYYHKLGTPQDSDTLVYQDATHPKRIFDLGTTDDGHYLIFTVDEGTDSRTGLMYLDLTVPGAQVTELFPPLKAAYSVIGNEGSLFYIMTDEGAPRGKVVAVDLQHPTVAKTIVPEGKDALKGVTLVHDKLMAAYLHDAHSRLLQYSTAGAMEREVTLPGLGTASEVNAHQADDEAFFSFTSFTVPMGVYRIDMTTGGVTPFYTPKTPIDPDRYETKQVFYRSKDGTRVPLYLCAHQGVMGKGPVRTLLYAYGGFDIPITPAYSTAAVAWMDQGGIYAVANIRGGGEYGEDWHRQGMLTHKQTVFDDFIAAAEYL